MEKTNESFSIINQNKDQSCSFSSLSFIDHEGNQNLTYESIRILFQNKTEEIENHAIKTQLLQILDKFKEKTGKPEFKLALEKLTKSNTEVQVSFDSTSNKLFAVKKLNLETNIISAIQEVINGFKIKCLSNTNGFVKFYDFFLETYDNPETEQNNKLKTLNVVMDLCECSLSDYLIFLTEEFVIMDEDDQNEMFDNMFLIIRQLIAALKNLHNSNMIHGDIKGNNVLLMRNVNSNYTVKIADFQRLKTILKIIN